MRYRTAARTDGSDLDKNAQAEGTNLEIIKFVKARTIPTTMVIIIIDLHHYDVLLLQPARSWKHKANTRTQK